MIRWLLRKAVTARAVELRGLLWVGVWLGLAACRTDPLDPGYGPNFEPRILAVTIPGIPTDSITIDHGRGLVLVTVPSSLSAASLTPTFRLTPLTRIDPAGSTIADNGTWKELTTQRIRLATNRNVSKTYRLVAQPAGPMRFAAYAGPPEYVLGITPQAVCFTVYNFRDSLASATLVLTPVGTGRFRQTQQYPTAQSPCDRSVRTDGAVVVSVGLNSYQYAPGRYQVSLRKDNGRTAVLDQLIRLTKGRPNLRPAYSPVLMASPYFVLDGQNLYDDSALSLRLTGSDGSRTVLFSQFDDYGTFAVFRAPADLKRGYYYAQLMQGSQQGDQPAGPPIRLVVITAADQPFVRTIYPYLSSGDDLLAPAADFTAPIVLTRGQGYSFSTSANGVSYPNVQTRIKLTSLTNPAEQYTVSAVSNTYDLFVLPLSVPAGRYSLVFQQGPPGQPLTDAEPLERPVQVN